MLSFFFFPKFPRIFPYVQKGDQRKNLRDSYESTQNPSDSLFKYKFLPFEQEGKPRDSCFSIYVIGLSQMHFL